jgi:(heptosyl)LPS beta-1,4-glucosyltransferase
MDKISAIIVVKDNPPYLAKTLQSIDKIVDEIVIVDIGMDNELRKTFDGSKKIKVKTIKEPVPYVELIREKTKSFAAHENILFLDPDEIVTPRLAEILVQNVGKYDYFRIPRKNLIFGRFIKHSRWWPDYQVRFFKKNKIKWPTIIHRQPEVKGSELLVEATEDNALLHYNYQNLDEYLGKAQRYAKHEAKEFIDNNKALSLRETVRRSLNEFFSRYFAGEGYKDGGQGFVLACFQMFYYFLVYFYYLEMNGFKQEKNVDTTEFFREGLKQSLHYKKNRTIKDWFIKKIC